MDSEGQIMILFYITLMTHMPWLEMTTWFGPLVNIPSNVTMESVKLILTMIFHNITTFHG